MAGRHRHESLTLCLLLVRLVVVLGDTEGAEINATMAGKHVQNSLQASALAAFESLESLIEKTNMTLSSNDDPSDVGKFHWMTSSSIALFTWCIWLSVALLVYRYAYSPRFVPEQNTSMSPKPDPRHTLENGHFGCADDSTVFMWACLCPAMRWADTVDNAGLLRFWYAFALFAALSLLNYMNFFIVLIVGICALLARACKFHTFIAGFALEGREDSYRRELSLLAMWLVTVALVVTVFLSVHSLLRQFDGVVKTYFGAYGCFVFGCFTTILMVYYRQQLRDKFALPSHTAEIYAEDFCYLFWCPCCGIAQEARAVNEAHQIGHESVQTVSAGKPDESYGTA